MGNIRFNDDMFTSKLEVNNIKAGEVAEHIEYVNNFKRRYGMHNIKNTLRLEDLNKVFKIGQSEYKLIGCRKTGKNMVCQKIGKQTLVLVNDQDVFNAIYKSKK